MVNYFEVERLFLQYTGLEEADARNWCEVLASCCDEIWMREKKGAESQLGESILNQLAAANAWYRYLLICEDSDSENPHGVQKMQMLDVSIQYGEPKSHLEQAEKLRKELAASAAPYLSDTGFVFHGM